MQTKLSFALSLVMKEKVFQHAKLMAFLLSVSLKYKVWVKIQGSSVINKMEFQLVIK